MKINIPYGKEHIGVDISASHEILLPNDFKIGDEGETLARAIAKPIGAEPFADFARKSKRLLVLVNDATRPTPTAKVLELLKDYLVKHPDVRFLVATGAHRAPTEEEYRQIFGQLYDTFRTRIHAHDARKDEDMVYLGKSKNGTEMYLNKMVPEIGSVLVIGSVEPHYFGGYTGGRKSFLPGVASLKTITMNHKLALNEAAKTLALDGNPVHEDMVDAMKVLEGINVFSIQTVLAGDHRIYAATAGDLFSSFDAAIEKANEIFCVNLRKKGNIVVAVAPYPMDIDLYQSQKALENGKLALERNGIIILVSKCRMGVGEDTFLKLLESAENPEEVMKKIGEGYVLGYHKAAKMAQIGTWAKMWAVTDLPGDVVRAAKMTAKKSIQSAIDEAISIVRERGDEPHIVVMPAGSLTVPLLKGDV